MEGVKTVGNRGWGRGVGREGVCEGASEGERKEEKGCRLCEIEGYNVHANGL